MTFNLTRIVGPRYVRARPELVAVLALVFIMCTFGTTWHLTLAPLVRNTYVLNADAMVC